MLMYMQYLQFQTIKLTQLTLEQSFIGILFSFQMVVLSIEIHLSRYI